MKAGSESGWVKSSLHPLERTFFPNPDIANDQNAEKDQHLNQPEQAEGFELHRPGKQEDGFHVEDHKEDGHNIETDGVAAPGMVYRINTALIRHEFRLLRIVRTNQLSRQQGHWEQNSY